MPFAKETSVRFPTEGGDPTNGTVKGYENGKYLIEVEGGKVIEVEEAKVELVIQMSNRGIYETIK